MGSWHAGMTANLVVHYALLLALAILLEGPVYLLLLRGRVPARRLLLVALVVNLLTNPLANFRTPLKVSPPPGTVMWGGVTGPKIFNNNG